MLVTRLLIKCIPHQPSSRLSVHTSFTLVTKLCDVSSGVSISNVSTDSTLIWSAFVIQQRVV